MVTKVVAKALTFDDVLLLPRYSECLPKDADLTTRLTRRIKLNIPLLSAAMDTVTESRLAIAIAEEGGLGILHKNMSIEAQASEVRKVKKFESGVVNDPITIRPDTTLQELKQITAVYNISGMPVVDGNQLLGIITSRDIRFANDLSQPVKNLMTPKERLITVHEHATRDEVMDLFRRNRVEKLLIVNDAFELRGMYTVKDILRAKTKPNACKNDSGQLRVGGAVGISIESRDRISALVAEGVDIVVVDTAHGHSKNVIATVKWVKQNYPNVDVMAGNIATEAAAKALIDAGADAIKIGMGPGSICTTRIVAGVGVPQISAIFNCAKAARKANVGVISDGGIRFSGDISKAIVAGADAIMIGSLFAGTEEAPGEVVLYQGRSYKSYRGMGSVEAMSQRHGSSDRYFQDANAEIGKFVPEGIEGRVPFKGPLQAVIHQLTGGLRSALGYVGCRTIVEMQKEAEMVEISSASMRESHVHDVIITKEAPNYWVDR